jgi:archaeal chaperonin
MMGQQGQIPILVLKEGTQREKGKGAQHNNIQAAKAIADAVRSTLGPKGMDKMLVDSMGDVVITNDGVTILKEIDVEHPGAKMLVEVAKTQDEECGDGTTTAVILAGELLKNAESLIEQNVHPTVINTGYRLAAAKATEILNKAAMDVSVNDVETLKIIATTSMSSKSASMSKDVLADVAVRAVKAIVEKRDNKLIADIDNIQIIKKHGGSVNDTEAIEGIIIDKEVVHPAMPKRVKNAKIALIDAAFEIKKTEVDAKIEIRDPNQLQAFLDEEEKTLRRHVDFVKKSGATVIFCQKGIDDLVQYYLSKEGIYAARRLKKSDMEKLAKATGAKIVSKINDLTKNDLGAAAMVEERKISDDNMTFVTGCKDAKAVSILIRGGTEHVVDEIERSLHDALSVIAVAIEDGKIATGGGSMATEISLRLRDYASSVGGREQMAIDAFADAIEVVPRTLAENAGLDPIDIVLELRKAHKSGKVHAGINVFTGKVTDMKKENVLEPVRVGTQAISSATEAATMILRIDDIIASRSGGGPGGAPGGMPPGGMGGMGGGEDY